MDGPAGAGGQAAAASAELVDVLDDEGRVVRTATRAEVRAGNLWHRAVFIAVVNARGELAVHQRAAWKDVWPSRWDVCFGRVLAAGESFEPAAARELAEEAGLELPAERFEPLGAGRYADDLVREQAEVFLVRADGPLRFADGEVAAADWVALDALEAWLAGRDLVPDSLTLVVPRLPTR